MSFAAKIEGNELALTVPMLAQPELSLTQKTLVIARTRTRQETGLTFRGRPVYVQLIAYILPEPTGAKIEKKR